MAGGCSAADDGTSGIYAAESPDGDDVDHSRSGGFDPTIRRIPVRGGAEEQAPGCPGLRAFALGDSCVRSHVVNGNGDLVFFHFGGNSVTMVFDEVRVPN